MTSLIESQVREIRESQESGAVLAKKYGVSKQLISNIKKRISWTHVK